MTRPKGSVNKPKYEQGQLPDEYLPKESTDFTQIRINKNLETYGEETKMKEMKHVVRTVSRANMISYTKDGQLQAVSMTETEAYMNQLLAAGWELFHVEVLGKNDVTFDMLYILTK